MGATHTPQLTLQVGDSSITALRSRKPGTTCTNDAPGRRCCQVERERPRRPGSHPPQGVARDSHGASPWRAGIAVGAPGWTLARVEAASRRFLPHSKAARCRFYLGPSLCIGCSRITLPRAPPARRTACARREADAPGTRGRPSTPGQSGSQVGAPGPGALPLFLPRRLPEPAPPARRGPSLCIGCSRITLPRARPALRTVCACRDDAGLTDRKRP
jgi:hypothetical protein